MFKFNKSKKTVIDDSLTNLIQVAFEDEQIRSQIISILSLDKTKRQFLLNYLLQEMKIKKAPEELIDAISAFQDDNIAEKALELLKEKEN